jgi:hypothetical protein
MSSDSIVMIVGVVALVLFAIYIVNPGMLGLRKEGFESGSANGSMPHTAPAGSASATSTGEKKQAMDVAGATQAALNMVKGATGAISNFTDGSGSGSAEGFESGPANFGDAAAPAGCYPRDQLQASELLPRDGNSVWAQQNPLGPGSLKGVNFLSAGALIGINTVGQSMKNANLQLRSEPPNPQVPISVFNNSTIEPDFNRRPLEIN